MITNEEMKKYILDKLETRNQIYLLNKITIYEKGDYLGYYDNETKEIAIYKDECIKQAIRSHYMTPEYLLASDYAMIDLTIKKIIDHELIHINQADILKKDLKGAELIRNDLEAIKNNTRLYIANQDLFVTEYNANYLALEQMIFNAKLIEDIPYFDVKDVVNYRNNYINVRNFYGAPYDQLKNKIDLPSIDLTSFNEEDKKQYGLIKNMS